MSNALVEVDRLGVRFRDTIALDELSFTVGRGELLAIVGPSGSGKTTLLRCVAGLVTPSEGEVRIAGHPVRGVPDQLALVFQDYSRSLFPWLSVGENVELPLRRLQLKTDERRHRVASSLAEVGLADAVHRYPWQLSGGMQQRVAIARAIACEPRILLMDEPFGSVDAQTRADLQDLALALWRAHASTILFVTHDIDESVYLADRVAVLTPAPGRVAAEVPIDLPRPRDQIETRASARFAALRAAVARLILRDPVT